MQQWRLQGVRFAEGMTARQRLMPLAMEAVPPHLSGQMMGSLMAAEASFTCVRPVYSTAALEQGANAWALGSECLGLEEGLAILAEAMQLPETMMPKIKPNATANWARMCALYDDGMTVEDFSVTWEELQERVERVPCMCR